MSSLAEPALSLLVIDRLRTGIRHLATLRSARSTRRDLKEMLSSSNRIILRLESSDSEFRDFATSCQLVDSGLTSDCIRRCSAIYLLPGTTTAGADFLAIRLGVINRQHRRGISTSSARNYDNQQPQQALQQQTRYTGIGKRAGGYGPISGTLSHRLGRILSGQQKDQQQQQQLQQHSGDASVDSTGSSSATASTQMQSLLRSVSRDVPLDPHAQSAVLLRLVDAYTRGVRDGVSGFGDGDKSDKQRRGFKASGALSNFLKIISMACLIGLPIFVIVSLLNSRDSLSKMIMPDMSIQRETSQVRFDDVRGCDAAKKELEDVVAFLKHPEDFQKIGAKLPRGVLLVGPPGVGKTMLAKAVAGEADVPFFQCSGSQFDEVFVGTGAARVRRLFLEAKKAAPSVIFIDEFDSVGGKRVTTTHHPYANQTVNQLLAEMDGFSTQDGVIVLAATNRPEILDSAVTRPGRFDVSVQVQLPDLAGRTSILELYLSKVAVADDLDIDRLAKITIGFSGAQLANVVNQGAVLAALEREQCINWRHIQTAYNKVRMGTAGNKPRTEHVNAMTAAHESGHTIVALFTKDAPKINHVTILPRGHSLGHTAPLPEEADQYGRKKSQLIAQIDMFMGGQAAEEALFGPDSVTTGCSDDLKQATQIARSMVEKMGMSETIGVMSITADESSQQTMALVDTEVKRMLDDSRERARRIVRDHRQELERLTSALLEFESLDYEDILRVVAGRRPLKAGGNQLQQKKQQQQQQQQKQSLLDGRDASWLKTLLGGGGGASGSGEAGSSSGGGGGSGATPADGVKPQSPKI